MSKILLVGGLPEPVGGVTNFVYRLLDNNLVDKLFDLYPSKLKHVPKEFKGEVIYCHSFIHFFLKYIFYKNVRRDIETIHFNFSKTKSLFFLFLLPKLGLKFNLMLHHGSLSLKTPFFVKKILLNKFDIVYSLSEKQTRFYTSCGVDLDRLMPKKSYLPIIPPADDLVDVDVKQAVNFFYNSSQYAVISGYCQELYNHHWVVDLFSSVEKEKGLLVFLYGNIDKKYLDSIMSKASSTDRVRIFFEKDSNTFNYALSKAKYYLRPNVKDSFGIAVADAVSFGIKVLASDVCARYPGTYLFTPSSYEDFVYEYLEFIKKPFITNPSNCKNSITNFSYN